MQLLNKTGGDSVYGEIVIADSVNDYAFKQCPLDDNHDKWADMRPELPTAPCVG